MGGLLVPILCLLGGLAWAEPEPVSDAETPAPHIKRNSLGMGLSGIADWSTQMPFIDFMKQARAWTDWHKQSASPPPFATDAQDWVTGLRPGQVAGTVFWVAPDPLPERYRRFVVLYEGEGTLQYRWATQKIAEESTVGRDVIRVGSGNNLLEITATNPKNYLRNIRIVPEIYEQAHRDGDIFNPEWTALVAQFNSLRFMDWAATNNSTIGRWADRAQVQDRSWAIKGVPWEVVMQVTRKLNAHPWINVPHLADKDYIDQLARLVHQQLPPSLSVYVEHSNEVWNWQFQQTQYADREGKKLWRRADAAFMQWHGLRTAEVCEAFKTGPFKAETQRVTCVLGVQTAWQGLEDYGLNCPAAVRGKQSPVPCHQRGIDAIGITTYFDGGLNGPHWDHPNPEYAQAIRRWAQAGSEGLDNAFRQLREGKLLDAYKKYEGVEKELLHTLGYWHKKAQQHGLRLVAYEGGQHITANSHVLQDDEAVVQFHSALNRDPRMGELYDRLASIWRHRGGALHTFFIDVAAPSKWGSWGSMETLWDAEASKWRAIVDFNQEVPCWWPDCAIEINEK